MITKKVNFTNEIGVVASIVKEYLEQYLDDTRIKILGAWWIQPSVLKEIIKVITKPLVIIFKN